MSNIKHLEFIPMLGKRRIWRLGCDTASEESPALLSLSFSPIVLGTDGGIAVEATVRDGGGGEFRVIVVVVVGAVSRDEANEEATTTSPSAKWYS
jgi:hypothetical protein